MWDKLLTSFEAHFNIYMLMLLMFILLGAHAVMMHWNRPPDMIHWAETLISGIFAALISELRSPTKPS